MPPLVLLFGACVLIGGLLWPSGNSDKKVTVTPPAKVKVKVIRRTITKIKRVKAKPAKEAKPDDENNPTD